MTGIAQDRTAQRSAGRKGRRQWVVRGFLGECRMTSCPSRHFIMKSFGIYYFVYVVPFEILPSFAALLMATVEKSSELPPKCRTLKMWVKFRSLIGGPDFLNVETKEITYYFLLNLSQAWNEHKLDFPAVEYLLSRFVECTVSREWTECWCSKGILSNRMLIQGNYGVILHTLGNSPAHSSPSILWNPAFPRIKWKYS